MGFIILPRLSPGTYKIPYRRKSPSLALFNVSDILLFSPRALNKSPAEILWKRNIHTRRCPVFLALPNSARLAPREIPALWIILPYFRFGTGGRGGEKKGGVRTFARATKRKRKRGSGEGGRERNEGKKREKRQRTGVGGACANAHRRVFSHGVAPRRQASSVARRAPSHLHVTPHRAARAHGSARSRTFLIAHLISLSHLLFRQTLPTHLKDYWGKQKKKKKNSRSIAKSNVRTAALTNEK